ncbi:hypothetical protein BB560_000331 [Smittium megazygosporum]|uniref:Endonuclease/exonuclease/phosphatase domain-containing protein n=1 Tax=Smittium megazygosporum TaxID=133381 RepID=A0A2T9ZKL4_9FUNG|nr:hypothetical protein BB560_000331 [Smittium megazygosporum]
MFPYASKQSLRWKFRRKNLLEEIFYHKPDIVCLQEVNIEHWHQVYNMEFKRQGYSGDIYFSSFKNHGIAILTKNSRFQNLEHIPVSLGNNARISEEFISPPNVGQILVCKFTSNNLKRKSPDNSDIESEENKDQTLNNPPPNNNIDCGNDAINVPCDSENNASSTVLQNESPGVEFGLIIANTHLYWQPEGNFERLLQTAKLLSEAKAVLEKYKDNYHLIFCGDLNLTPDDTIYAMLTRPRPLQLSQEEIEQILPKTFGDSDDGSDDEMQPESGSTNNKDDDKKQSSLDSKSLLMKKQNDLELALQTDLARVGDIVSFFDTELAEFKFTSSYGNYAQYDSTHLVSHHDPPLWIGEPQFTNYTNWKGTLDYIFIHSPSDTNFYPSLSLRQNQLLLIPDKKHLHPGLPNDYFSSDHLSLISVFDLIIGQNSKK